MRVISGEKKGFNLFSVEGYTSRPTTDFMREYIYSVLQDVDGFIVLDLYAGTGALGIEALSRGAVWADFVDFSSNAINAIIKNLDKTDYTEKSHVYRKKADRFLRSCDKQYDLIFLDPPYDKDLVNDTISLIFTHNLVKENGVIVIDHSSNEAINPEFLKYLMHEKKKKAVTVTLLLITDNKGTTDENL
ncbi:MAG: 16S rRNA (guanine(966)-N(2))-methyltransferase RsmD [Candidatus Cloacimonetes bacterium]|nr:16S rRNA (guanine(966)-N(2))-methyltransferase RsmD [Candidatus Cloacimonadota bacterium]